MKIMYDDDFKLAVDLMFVVHALGFLGWTLLSFSIIGTFDSFIVQFLVTFLLVGSGFLGYLVRLMLGFFRFDKWHFVFMLYSLIGFVGGMLELIQIILY